MASLFDSALRGDHGPFAKFGVRRFAFALDSVLGMCHRLQLCVSSVSQSWRFTTRLLTVGRTLAGGVCRNFGTTYRGQSSKPYCF